MIRICKENRISVLEQVRNGKLDNAMLSSTNLIDEIILTMHDNHLLSEIGKSIPDLRASNSVIPYDVIWASAIAAKMKVHTSLSDIPFAISDHRTLAKLGYALVDYEEGVYTGLMREGSLRFLLGKYTQQMLIDGYNQAVQKYILPKLDLSANIHILDCTDIEVNYWNTNYEGSGVAYSKRKKDENADKTRGYKLSTLRGIIKDSGVIEEIQFGPLNVHDLALSEEMLRTSPALKPEDILINDRGFLSRDLINYLKTHRKVDTYIPLRSNMVAYDMAVKAAQAQNDWHKHPITRYRTQVMTLVTDLGPYWESQNPEDDVGFNGCVVWDKATDNYAVFITTDLSKNASDILKTYCLRPEIEEDYRQIKDFWKIEDFKSTKLNVIVFHVVCVLFGYLFFQLYTMLPNGEQYLGRSLPVVLKGYNAKVQGYIVLYVGIEFGILTLLEMMKLYAESDEAIRTKLNPIFAQL